jgi:hypothetical protein
VVALVLLALAVPETRTVDEPPGIAEREATAVS